MPKVFPYIMCWKGLIPKEEKRTINRVYCTLDILDFFYATTASFGFKCET